VLGQVGRARSVGYPPPQEVSPLVCVCVCVCVNVMLLLLCVILTIFITVVVPAKHDYVGKVDASTVCQGRRDGRPTSERVRCGRLCKRCAWLVIDTCDPTGPSCFMEGEISHFLTEEFDSEDDDCTGFDDGFKDGIQRVYRRMCSSCVTGLFSEGRLSVCMPRDVTAGIRGCAMCPQTDFVEQSRDEGCVQCAECGVACHRACAFEWYNPDDVVDGNNRTTFYCGTCAAVVAARVWGGRLDAAASGVGKAALPSPAAATATTASPAGGGQQKEQQQQGETEEQVEDVRAALHTFLTEVLKKIPG
jgi:hypothetical protein